MKTPIIVACVLTALAIAWVVSGQVPGLGGEADKHAQPAEAAKPGAGQTQVRVTRLNATQRERHIVVSGRTEASRSVDLRAQIEGRVVEVLVEKGASVKEGNVILRLAVDERKARLDESQALLKQRELEYGAARELQQRGFRSDTSLAQAAAQLDAARSVVQRMQIEFANTIVKAPFDGVIGHERAEVGQLLRVGDKGATLVDLHPLLIVGWAAEREVGGLVLGTPGQARLVDGSVIEGVVTYIAAQADPATRTYRFELQVPNLDEAIRAGLSCEIAVPVASAMAHSLSPAVLSLADDGTLGVKVVNARNRVEFLPVTVVGETPEGLWVTGLPDAVTLITVGQDFVVAGQEVSPIAMPLPGGA